MLIKKILETLKTHKKTFKRKYYLGWPNKRRVEFKGETFFIKNQLTYLLPTYLPIQMSIYLPTYLFELNF
jgi:hypothetical protein